MTAGDTLVFILWLVSGHAKNREAAHYRSQRNLYSVFPLCECSRTSVGSMLLLCSMPCVKQTLQQYHTSHLVHSAKDVFFSDFLLILGYDEHCTQLQGPHKAEEGLD